VDKRHSIMEREFRREWQDNRWSIYSWYSEYWDEWWGDYDDVEEYYWEDVYISDDVRWDERGKSHYHRLSSFRGTRNVKLERVEWHPLYGHGTLFDMTTIYGKSRRRELLIDMLLDEDDGRLVRKSTTIGDLFPDLRYLSTKE
jgi:hypothetical protein